MNGLIWLTVLVYVVGRTGGKFAGVWLGSRLAAAPDVIRRYLGFCLFSQAGVAIGLAVLSSQVFSTHPEVSATIVAVVTATTFIVQVIGPPSVKYAVTKAGEVGRNVTEEDLLATLCVKDVMRTNQPALRLHAPLAEVMDTVARSEAVYFPVVDSDDLFRGVVTLEGMKAVLNMPDVGPFIVAEDLMEQVQYTVKPDASLRDAKRLMKDRARDFLVVTEPSDDRRLAGLITQRSIDRALETEIARRRGHSEVPAVA